VKVHDELTAIVTALMKMPLAPGVGENVPDEQLLIAFGEASTVIPDGNTSSTPTALSATTLIEGFVMVNDKVEVPPAEIDDGVNAFVIEGGAVTVRLATLLTSPGEEFSLAIMPVITFGCVPVVLLVTS
jgi:hypothetical protein